MWLPGVLEFLVLTLEASLSSVALSAAVVASGALVGALFWVTMGSFTTYNTPALSPHPVNDAGERVWPLLRLARPAG